MSNDMKVMFLIGGIIFAGYIFGLLKAIMWGHKSQEEERLNDPELRNYYSRYNNLYEKKSNGVVLKEKTKRTKRQKRKKYENRY